MPLIEELAVASTVKASHGWAYVPDTGPLSAHQPGDRPRKRVAAATSRNAATASAKHQKSIQQRLESLNKENYKDGVTVPIPTRSGSSSGAQEQAGKKTTGNVRRILTYQRGFAHYLADEEANNPGGKFYQLPSVPSGMGPPAVPVVVAAPTMDAKAQRGAAGRDEGRRKSGVSRTRPATIETAPVTPVQARGRRRGPGSRTRSSVDEQDVSTPAAPEQAPIKPEDMDTPMTDAAAVAVADTESLAAPPIPSPFHPSPTDLKPNSTSTSDPDPDSTSIYPPTWDLDPLLTSVPSEVPPLPSDKIMQLLISEPSLTYKAVRATPLEPKHQRPPRRFCGVCGYWGRVKCRKCEEWTCGIMECWRGHEGVCVVGGFG